MTAYELQIELAKEIEEIEKNVLLKDVRGNPVHIKAFIQSLPKRIQKVSDEDEEQEGIVMLDNDPENDPYPYCIVQINSGRLETSQSPHEITLSLVFGIFDDDIECQGHLVIMNMIHNIAERFTKNPVLNNRYRINNENGIIWVINDDDRYPYYFGAMEMTWDAFFVGREDDKYA